MATSSESPGGTAFPGSVPESATLELVGRIRAGDTAAFDDLYRRYHDELLFAVRAHLGAGLRSALESEDVLQSVVVDAFKALPNFEPRGPGSLRHYLHAMIVNKIRTRAKYFGADKRAGTLPLSESCADGLADGELQPTYHDGERFEALEKAIRQLPEDMRRIVVLRKIDGLPSKEAAEVLGLNDTAARKLFSRSLARLTGLMRGMESED